MYFSTFVLRLSFIRRQSKKGFKLELTNSNIFLIPLTYSWILQDQESEMSAFFKLIHNNSAAKESNGNSLMIILWLIQYIISTPVSFLLTGFPLILGFSSKNKSFWHLDY